MHLYTSTPSSNPNPAVSVCFYLFFPLSNEPPFSFIQSLSPLINYLETEREATYESGVQAKQQKDQYPAPGSCGISHQNPHKIQSTKKKLEIISCTADQIDAF